LKAVCILYIGTKGAGPLFSIELARSLLECGYRVSVIVVNDVENWSDLQNLGIEVHSIQSNYRFFFSKIWLFVKLLFRLVKHKKRYDCLIIPMASIYDFILLNSLNFDKSILFFHDPIPHPGFNQVVRYFELRALKKVDHIVILNPKFQEFTRDFLGKELSRISYFPHPYFSVNLERIGFLREETRRINLVYFGRIEDYKGIDILGKCFNENSLQLSNFDLTIIGTGNFGKYRHYFDNFDSFKLVNEYVSLESLPSYLNKPNTIMVLPYTSATQSGVVPLIMRLGIPLILSDLDVFKLQTGGHAYFFESSNVVSLFEILLYCSRNLAEVGTKSNNAELYIDNFSFKTLVDKYLLPLL
jgi:glycosyltransferase involved in cell wall biosynthesis